MRFEELGEPDLTFGGSKQFVDPKLGLWSFGPYGTDPQDGSANTTVRAGAIGTLNSLSSLRRFLERIQHRIGAPAIAGPSPRKVDFPGVGSKRPLRFDIDLRQDSTEMIRPDEEDGILGVDNRNERIVKMLELYNTKFENLTKAAHPAPQIVFLPLSQRFIDRCKDPQFAIERIVYARRTHDLEVGPGPIPLFDFHNALKVIGFRYKVATQVLRQQTLELDAGPQDASTLAWNFAVATYYKATGTPWKLADLDANSCYVGISFYVEPGEGGSLLRAAMAHVYMRTGESQVIRSKPFKWEDASGRSPILTSDQATQILQDVVSLFESQQGKKPTRIVVHKSSPFEQAEAEGFKRAAEGAQGLDLVHISPYSDVRFYVKGSAYPPRRGTLVWNGTSPPLWLYTTGFIPALGTYPGSSVPIPLQLSWSHIDSTPVQVAKDVLLLTKLDWNNADFCTRMPVTIGVSRKVGRILAESSAGGVDPPSQYSFYM